MHQHHQDQLYEQQAVQQHEAQLPANSQQQQQQQEDQQQLLQVSVSRAEEPPGFQLLVTLPGCCLEDVRIEAWDGGRLLIRAALQPAATGSAGATHGPAANSAAATATAAGQQLGDGQDAQEASAGDAVAQAGVGGQVVERVVQLPGRIAASTAGALMTQHGQLYVRVNDAQ
jgi:HSP20 family molecular chaperone IbpA